MSDGWGFAVVVCVWGGGGGVAGLIQGEVLYDLPEILLGNERTLQRIAVGGKAVLKALQVNHQTFSVRSFFLFYLKSCHVSENENFCQIVVALGLVSYICSPVPRTNTPVCVIRVAA